MCAEVMLVVGEYVSVCVCVGVWVCAGGHAMCICVLCVCVLEVMQCVYVCLCLHCAGVPVCKTGSAEGGARKVVGSSSQQEPFDAQYPKVFWIIILLCNILFCKFSALLRVRLLI